VLVVRCRLVDLSCMWRCASKAEYAIQVTDTVDCSSSIVSTKTFIVPVASIIINVQHLSLLLRCGSRLRSSGVWRRVTGYWCPTVRNSVVPSTSEVYRRPRTKPVELWWWRHAVPRYPWDQLPIEVVSHNRKTVSSIVTTLAHAPPLQGWVFYFIRIG